jgi:Flp pilus assembly protein TadD
VREYCRRLQNLLGATNAIRVQVIIVVIASIAVYFNALSNSFVFDDAYQVLDNHWIRNVRFIPTIFSHSAWGFDTSTSSLQYYRPVMHLVYMFNYHVFGLNPWGFHLVNMLFHVGISVLVFVIAKHLLTDSSSSSPFTYFSPAFIAAILFATHPIHTEVVAWVAAVPELVFTLFYLLAFYFYLRSEKGGKSSYAFSLVAFVFALFSKETAVTLPIIIAAYDYALRKENSKFAAGYLKRYAPYLIITALYLVARSYGLRDVTHVKKVFELSAFEYVINVFSFFTQYLGKLIFPVQLNAYHIFHPLSSFLEPRGLLALIITLAFILFIVAALKINRLVFWCLALVIVPLLPTFYIIGNTEVGISERYLYLPSLGFVLLLAVLVDKIRAKKPKMTMGLGIILLLVVGSYSVGTISRNSVWKDEYALWTDTVKKSPDSAFVHRAFGGALFNRQSVDKALKEFLLAAKFNPNDAEAHMCLGASYSRMGMLDKAVEHYNLSLLLKPVNWEVNYGLGVTYINMGRVDEGIEQLETSLRLKSDFGDAHKNICVAYMVKGVLAKAVEHCRIAVKLTPNDSDAHYKLALAYKKNGSIYDAIGEYEIALKLMPTAAAHNDLGILYDSVGMSDKAIEHYQAAIKQQSDDAKAYNNLGIVCAKMGLIDKAIENLEKAVKIEPNNQGFRLNLERLYGIKNSPRKESD